MTNLHYGTIKEALKILMHDRYHMPENMHDFIEKAHLIEETYYEIEKLQERLPKQEVPF